MLVDIVCNNRKNRAAETDSFVFLNYLEEVSGLFEKPKWLNNLFY